MVMINIDFSLDSRKEIDKIVSFIRTKIVDAEKSHVLIASSGGIDSSVSLSLAVKAVGPKNVYVLSLPYKHLNEKGVGLTKQLITILEIPQTNFQIIDISKPTDMCIDALSIPKKDIYRRGNIMARVRMIYLFDQAKKHNGLVIGTENKSELLLGYFTRFGDEASDIEPIQHLYKTQIYMIAQELDIPSDIISQVPTAGLWEDQTDEGQFGFGYEEADKVLFSHFETNIPFDDLEIIDFPHLSQIQNLVEQNSFKHHVPYVITSK